MVLSGRESQVDAAAVHDVQRAPGLAGLVHNSHGGLPHDKRHGGASLTTCSAGMVSQSSLSARSTEFPSIKAPCSLSSLSSAYSSAASELTDEGLDPHLVRIAATRRRVLLILRERAAVRLCTFANTTSPP